MAIHFNGKVFDKNHPATEADIQEMLDWTQGEIDRENAEWDALPAEEKERREREYQQMLKDNPMLARWEADNESILECGHL